MRLYQAKPENEECEMRDLLIQADKRDIDAFKIVYRNYLHHKTLYM